MSRPEAYRKSLIRFSSSYVDVLCMDVVVVQQW